MLVESGGKMNKSKKTYVITVGNENHLSVQSFPSAKQMAKFIKSINDKSALIEVELVSTENSK